MNYVLETIDQYLIDPKHVESSWKAFFQGFKFGIQESKKEKLAFGQVEVPDNILKDSKVMKLIHAFRNRGHLFTKTNLDHNMFLETPTLDSNDYPKSS